MSNRFPKKHPGESFAVGFDFSRLTTVINSASVEVSVMSGVDPNAATMLVGAPQIDGGQVVQSIAGGVDGVHYILQATVSDGVDTWVHEQILPVGSIRN